MSMARAVDSPSLPGGQDMNISSIFPHFPVVSFILPQVFFIFFLILVFRVGNSPTRKGPGYATEYGSYFVVLQIVRIWTTRHVMDIFANSVHVKIV